MMITQPHCVCVDRKKIELYFYLRHTDIMIKYILKRLAKLIRAHALKWTKKTLGVAALRVFAILISNVVITSSYTVVILTCQGQTLRAECSAVLTR